MLLQCPPKNHSTYWLIKQLNIDLKGYDLIHAGSHDLIERQTYEALGVNKVYAIECNPFVFCDLQERLRGTSWRAIQACLWSKSGEEKELKFYRQKKDGAASLFHADKMGDHVDCPETGETIKLKTSTLDQYISDGIIDISNVKLAIFDLQGAELEALKGSELLLQSEKLEWIICEVSTFSCYSQGAQEKDINYFLKCHGFDKVAFQRDWGRGHTQHGDNVYHRNQS